MLFIQLKVNSHIEETISLKISSHDWSAPQNTVQPF